MHKSLIKEIRDKYLVPMVPPVCDIIDFHMHVSGGKEDEKYIRIAKEFGVVQAGAMLHWTDSKSLLARHGDFFFPIDWVKMPSLSSKKSWVKEEIKRLEEAATDGLVALKLRSTCKEGRPKVWIDHPYLIEVLNEAARMGLFLYVHIAEPSVWWPSKLDPTVVGEKLDYHKPLETILQNCQDLRVVGSHLGGYPEDLDFLDEMLGRYKNYDLDLSATKWIVRELGRDTLSSKNFITKHQDRLLFGSDLVAFLSDGEEDYYRSRLWVLRHLFESDEVVPSMIADPDSTGLDYPRGAEVRGLGLDEEILKKIYRGNALKYLVK